MRLLRVCILTAVVPSVGAMFGIPSAQAAVPKVAGKYAVMIWELCQTRFFTNLDWFVKPNSPNGRAVVSVEPEIDGFGKLRMQVGSVTFPTTASSSGQVSAQFVIVQGAAAKINHRGGNIARSTAGIVSAFSFTTTTLTIGGAVYDIQVADVVAGVAKSIFGVARPQGGAPPCANAMTLTKQ